MSLNHNCEDIFSFAKLQPCHYHKISQSISFTEDFNKEIFYIFQVNNEILDTLNLSDEPHLASFSIKGNHDEIAVLCTENGSYEIRESETSNTLLVSPDLELNFENIESESFITKKSVISSTCNKIFELTLRKAKIGEVYKILQNSIFYHHIEDEPNYHYFDFPTLLDKVRMSEYELKDSLSNLKVYKINGNLRMLHIDYICDIILKIVECSFENDFSIFNFSQQNVYSLLQNLFPLDILEQTLNFYFVKVSEDKFDTFWKINELEVTRCVAEEILNKYNQLSVDDFVVLWNKRLPEELTGRLSDLHGLAVIITDAKVPFIKLLKSVTLPDEPEERFKALFNQKSIWIQEELEGFIQDIIPRDSTASQLMMRYCRCSTSANIKTFSKR